MLIVRRNFMSVDKLPYDAEVEYLQGDFKSFVDTEIIPDENTKLIIKLAQQSYNGKWEAVCGCRYQTADGVWFGLQKATTNRGLRGCVGNGLAKPEGIGDGTCYVGIAYNDLAEHTIEIRDFSFYVEGRLKGTVANRSKFNIRRSLYLFANNIGGLASEYDDSRIYSVSLRQGDLIVRDFIAVRKDGVGYMYDKVSGKLFGNAGTGVLVIGPDKLRNGGGV